MPRNRQAGAPPKKQKARSHKQARNDKAGSRTRPRHSNTTGPTPVDTRRSNRLKEPANTSARSGKCAITEARERERKPSPRSSWKLWHASDVENWQVLPFGWIVEDVIQRDALGFFSGPPKVGKSFLALDLCDTIRRGGSWLGKYPCRAINVLYIAREDPARRVRERLLEIQKATTGPAQGKLLFIIRERVNLLDTAHIEEIKRLTREHHIGLVVLDVVNRMIPGLDENDATDVGTMVDKLEEIRSALGVTVIAVDHTRKPPSGQRQSVGPFELKGSIAKFGACDFIICAGRRDSDLEVYFENKDVDHASRLLLAVSSKNASGPKFRIKQELEATAADRKTTGARNREKVFAAVGEEWTSKGDIANGIRMSSSTVGGHLKTLVDAARIEKRGSNRMTQYRRSPPTGRVEQVDR